MDAKFKQFQTHGHKIRSLEGENEIQHILILIPVFDFSTILDPLDGYETNFHLVKLISKPLGLQPLLVRNQLYK